jgi:hypothetical protein
MLTHSSRLLDDCVSETGVIPPHKQPPTSAQIVFDLVIDHPYEHTSDDVLYLAYGEPRGLSRGEHYSKGQPCFRASPITKRYGWGVHFDAQGKIAFYARDSEEYQKLSHDPDLTQLIALRNKKS